VQKIVINLPSGRVKMISRCRWERNKLLHTTKAERGYYQRISKLLKVQIRWRSRNQWWVCIRVGLNQR